jgi:hypothetical protein
MAMSPMRLGTKNDRVGEHQQQFTRPTSKLVLSFNISSPYLATTSGQTDDLMCSVVFVIGRMRESVRLLQLFVVRVISFQ